MNKRISALIILFLSTFSVFGQQPEVNGSLGGVIEGTLKDSLSGAPIEFAAIALWDATKAVDGALTGLDGKFKFENLKAGNYKLIISYIGYNARSIDNLQISSSNRAIRMPNILLIGDNIQLEEVTVTGQASLVEDKIDRLVYNAEKDITNRGGSAEEVLRKVPMLSVDLDGEVELRGSGNVRVLIDNKPSSIFASSVGEALRQIPADQIKSVEVITSPSARYEGDGTAGIINIILKKNTLSGVTGMVSSGVGVLGSFLNGNLNIKDRKWGFSLNGGGRASYNFKTIGENTRTSVIDGVATYMTQKDDNRGNWANGRYSGTLTYDFDQKTNLSLTYSGRLRNNGSIGDQVTTLLGDNNNLIFENTRYINQKNRSNSDDIDFTFSKRYNNPIQELIIMAQWSQNNRRDFFTAAENRIPADSSDNRGIDRDINLQLDYVQPLGNKLKWEMGGRATLRSATSDGKFFNFVPETGDYVSNSTRSNFLDYDQNIVAGYSSFTLDLPQKWGLQAGVRYEKTMINAQFKEQADVNIPDYANWLPSFNLSKRFEEGGSIRFSYTQRIQRPSIRFLNPYVNYANANSVSFGDPLLDPVKVNMAEVSWSTYFDKNSLNISLYSRMEDNSITSVSSVVRQDGIDITQTTYANIGINRRFGLDLSYAINVNSNWRIGGGFSPGYTYMDNRTISNKGWNYGVNLNTQYTLSKGWAVAGFGSYNSPRVQLQGNRNGFYFHGLTVKKDINNKRGSIGLGVENPFVRSINFKSELATRTDAMNYFITQNTSSVYRRSIRIDFSYRFGKMESSNSNGRGLFNRRRGNGNGNNTESTNFENNEVEQFDGGGSNNSTSGGQNMMR
jgi:outer membrane receptor protein involved in Fe transport